MIFQQKPTATTTNPRNLSAKPNTRNSHGKAQQHHRTRSITTNVDQPVEVGDHIGTARPVEAGDQINITRPVEVGDQISIT
jgi:ribosomal protein S28E/S33